MELASGRAVTCPVCESTTDALEEMNGFPMCEDCASEFPDEQNIDEEAILALRRELGLDGAWE